MNILEKYAAAEQAGEFNELIETEKGIFLVGEIYSMLLHHHRKEHGKQKRMPAPTAGKMAKALRKLRVKQQINSENQAAIYYISKKHFPDSRVLYVNDYNSSGEGISIDWTSWDGSHKIKLGFNDYVSVNYRNYKEIEGFYFFTANDTINLIIAMDKKAFDFLMFGRLNHEQRVAKQFIDFIDESFESMGIFTRYSLSNFFEKMLAGNFGSVNFFNTALSNECADAEIMSKNGPFLCKAYFDGFERKGVINKILVNK